MSRKRKSKKSKSGQWTTTGLADSSEMSGTGTSVPSEASEDRLNGNASDYANNTVAGSAEQRVESITESEAASGENPGEARDAAESPPAQSSRPAPSSSTPVGAAEDRFADAKATERPNPESDRDSMSDEQPPPQGFFAKIARWWRGPSPVTVRVPSNPPGSMSGQRIPTPACVPSPASVESASAVQPSERIPSEQISELSGGLTGGGPSSAISQVHAVLMLERVVPELDETKRLLQEERDSSQNKIRELEEQCDRFRADAEKARNERSDLEGHTNMLRKSVGALERQLQDERTETAGKIEEYEARLKSFEESVKNSHSPVEQLRSELAESRLQREQIESLLESAKDDLESVRRELQEEREASQGRLHQLESELSRKSGANEQAISERARIEERAALVQKALDVMEQQLREERESFAKQSKQLESELNQARAKNTQLETRVNTLIGELEKAKTRSKKKKAVEEEVEDSSTLTTGSARRIEALESELATDASPMPTDKQTATTRISRLESRWEDLKARLLPKDREISELRQLTDRLRAEIEELEAELTKSQQSGDAAAQAAETEGEEAEGGLLPLSREMVSALYSQSMGKLTVLMASADIVLMNPKLDPKAKGSVEDIKAEGQALLELIKSYTIPPEAKKSE